MQTLHRYGRYAHHHAPGAAWSKKMTGQVAWALLVHTLLLIFLVSKAMESSGMSILPYFLLVIMTAIFIPIGRHYDRRWRWFAQSELSDVSLSTRFRMDQVQLWAYALLMPVGWLLLAKLLF